MHLASCLDFDGRVVPLLLAQFLGISVFPSSPDMCLVISSLTTASCGYEIRGGRGERERGRMERGRGR